MSDPFEGHERRAAEFAARRPDPSEDLSLLGRLRASVAQGEASMFPTDNDAMFPTQGYPMNEIDANWTALLDEIKRQNAQGLVVRGNKKYTSVAVRNEVARRFLGDQIGISTEIIHWAPEKGSLIVVKATIRRTDDDRVLATGHAEEIRGQGQVNTTSALENAETSAIGRALAALGCSGGEFASANELDGAERKKDAVKERPAQPVSAPVTPAEPPHDPDTGEITNRRPSDGEAIRGTWEDGIRDALPANATAEDFWYAAAAQLRAEIAGYKSAKGLDGFDAKYADILGRMPRDLFEDILAASIKRRTAIEAAGKSPILTKAVGTAIIDTLGLCEDEATLVSYIATLEPYQREHPKIVREIEARRLALSEPSYADLMRG